MFDVPFPHCPSVFSIYYSHQFLLCSQLIAVFGHILCGKLDAAVLRYIVLMAELVNCVSWKLAADFQMFGSVVYSLQVSYQF